MAINQFRLLHFDTDPDPIPDPIPDPTGPTVGTVGTVPYPLYSVRKKSLPGLQNRPTSGTVPTKPEYRRYVHYAKKIRAGE